MVKNGEGWKVAAVLSLAAMVRIYFALTAPLEPDQITGKLSVYNDEPAHRSVVQFWAQEGRHPTRGIDPTKPVPIESGNIMCRTGEDFQPPFYYMLAALVYRGSGLVGISDPFILVRFLSIGLGLVALLFSYACFRFVLSPTESLATLTFGALLLSQVRFTSLVTNDALLLAISAGVVFFLIKKIVHNLTIQDRIILIMLLIAGLWTKVSFLPLIFASPVIWLVGLHTYNDRKFPWLEVVIPLVAWIPWLLWNKATWGNYLPLSAGFGTPWTLGTGLHWVLASGGYAIRSFWFPFDDIWGGGIRPLLFLVLGLAGAVILIFGVREIIRQYGLWRSFSSAQPAFLGIATILIVIGLMLSSLVIINLHYSLSEARLLFPTYTPIMILLGLGCRRLISPKIGPWILPAMAGFSYLIFL
jgi:hypothetical protein